MKQETIISEESVTNKDQELWTVKKCMDEAAKINIHLTRPTIVRICQERGIGHQPNGAYGKWLVHSEDFMRIIKGALF